MDLVTLSVRNHLLAFDAMQIERVIEWPADVPFPTADLGEALAVGRQSEPARLIVLQRPSGTHGLRVGREIGRTQHAAELYRLPRALQSWRHAPWLVGVALIDGKPRALIDLHTLVDRELKPRRRDS